MPLLQNCLAQGNLPAREDIWLHSHICFSWSALPPDPATHQLDPWTEALMLFSRPGSQGPSPDSLPHVFFKTLASSDLNSIFSLAWILGCMPTYGNWTSLKLTQKFFEYFSFLNLWAIYMNSGLVSLHSFLPAPEYRMGFRTANLALYGLTSRPNISKLELHQYFVKPSCLMDQLKFPTDVVLSIKIASCVWTKPL